MADILSLTNPVAKHQDAIDAIIARTIEYISVPCVVGHEQHFLNYLAREYESMGLKAIRHEGLLEIHGNRPTSAI